MRRGVSPAAGHTGSRRRLRPGWLPRPRGTDVGWVVGRAVREQEDRRGFHRDEEGPARLRSLTARPLAAPRTTSRNRR